LGRRSTLDRLAPLLAALVIAAVWMAVHPHTVDMAAHTFRAKLFGQEGFTIWNGQWYGGHHTPGYSVLFPPLAWALGPWVAGALSAVAAAALFEPLARGHWGERGRLGALWFGIGTGTLLFTGRLPFAMGVAFGIASLLALQRRRIRLAVLAAIGSGLASPVAALFLTLAALAAAFTATTRRPALLVAGVALGSATWVTVLASVVAVIRRAVGPRAIRAADTIAGVGLVGFGGALAYGAVHDR